MTDTPTTPTRARRVVVVEFISLDGYIVAEDEDMSWVADGFDPQMQEDIAVAVDRDYDVFVFGRVTYDIFAAYWPHALAYEEDDAVAPAEGKEDPRIIRALNDRPKVVFSTTLTEPKWEGTTVVAGDVQAEIRRLTSADGGGTIAVQGSASIARELARGDLVDEYRLYVHPVTLGGGTLLHAPGADRHDFELTRLTRYGNGVVATVYERQRGETVGAHRDHGGTR